MTVLRCRQVQDACSVYTCGQDARFGAYSKHACATTAATHRAVQCEMGAWYQVIPHGPKIAFASLRFKMQLGRKVKAANHAVAQIKQLRMVNGHGKDVSLEQASRSESPGLQMDCLFMANFE